MNERNQLRLADILNLPFEQFPILILEHIAIVKEPFKILIIQINLILEFRKSRREQFIEVVQFFPVRYFQCLKGIDSDTVGNLELANLHELLMLVDV